MVTDPAADAGKGVDLPDEFVSLIHSSLRDQGDIALGVHPDGTGDPAWGLLSLINGQARGRCPLKERFSPVRSLHRTNLEAPPAVHAPFRKNPLGSLNHVDIDPVCRFADVRDLRLGGQGNQGMVGNLGAEIVVPAPALRAPTSRGRGHFKALFDHGDPSAQIAQGNGRLKPLRRGADNQYSVV
jgi:hypothetical protein